jgi:hypothetical protein
VLSLHSSRDPFHACAGYSARRAEHAERQAQLAAKR